MPASHFWSWWELIEGSGGGGLWILATGIWDDAGEWIDTENWID